MFTSKVILFERFFHRYTRDVEGNFATIFAIIVAFLTIIVIGALDFELAVRKKQNLQDHSDAAALAAAKLMYLEKKDVEHAQQIVDNMLDHILKNGDVTCDPIIAKDNAVTINCIGGSNGMVPNLVGRDKMRFNSKSSAMAGFGKKYEISFVYDISDSMKGQDIVALESSLSEFVNNELFTDESNGAIFSLIPFANTVSFDDSYDKWLDMVDGLRLTPNFSGCFTSDTADITQAFTGMRSETSAPMEVDTGKVGCPPQSMAARFFNTDQSSVTSMITGIDTTFGTGLSEALTWGYRSLHPEMRNVLTSSSAFPRDFDEKNKKILILLTDGSPLNRPWEGEGTYNGGKDALLEASYDKFVETCDHIASTNEDIHIYVVAFGDLVSKIDLNLQVALENCTQGTGKFFTADSSDLSSVITGIVDNEQWLRLSQ